MAALIVDDVGIETERVECETCAVCLEAISNQRVTVDCGHAFCSSCAAGLRRHCIEKCPLCRGSIAWDDETTFEGAFRKYSRVSNQIEREGLDWQALPEALQCEMDAVREIWESEHLVGVVRASNMLGFLHFMGQSLVQSDVIAARYWQTAAAEGLAAAQLNLGRMYEQGRGVLETSDRLAVEWYRRSSRQGYMLGHVHLGRMFAEGRGGLPQNRAKAQRLWERVSQSEGLGASAEEGGDANDWTTHLKPGPSKPKPSAVGKKGRKNGKKKKAAKAAWSNAQKPKQTPASRVDK